MHAGEIPSLCSCSCHSVKTHFETKPKYHVSLNQSWRTQLTPPAPPEVLSKLIERLLQPIITQIHKHEDESARLLRQRLKIICLHLPHPASLARVKPSFCFSVQLCKNNRERFLLFVCTMQEHQDRAPPF